MPFQVIRANNYFANKTLKHASWNSFKIIDDGVILPPDNTDINYAKHKKQFFSMFGGETEKVNIEMHESLTDVIFDVFGDKVKIRKLNDGFVRFSADVQVSPVFYGWRCSFGANLRVTSPQVLLTD